MTADEIEARLARRGRPILFAVLVSIPATPVAVLLLQAIGVWKFPYILDTPLVLAGAFCFWTSVMWVAIGISGFFLIRRSRRFGREVRSLLGGTRHEGRVVDVSGSQRSVRGVIQLSRTVTVEAGGARFVASVEEPVGTELPAVAPGDQASVWSGPNGVLIAAGEGLFTAAAPANG